MTDILRAHRAPWQPCAAVGWSQQQLKRPFSINLGKMLQNAPASTEDVEVPYLKAQHVQWNGVRLFDLPTMWASPAEIAGLEVRAGDLLVCEGGEVGRAALVSEQPPAQTIIQNALHLVRGRASAEPRFLAYVLHHAAAQGWFDVLCNRSTIAHFTVEKFGEMWTWLPEASLQRAIADYLDRETAWLDGLVAAKERVLGLLAEKWRALITRAVTRGLDPRAPLRDSGIPWLGEIPAGWQILRLKFGCESLQTGPFGSQLHAEDYIENGVPVINPAHLVKGKIVPDNQVSVDDETSARLAIHGLESGDIVFARRGELGRCGLVTDAEAGWLCGTGSLRARPCKDKLLSEYVILVMANTFAADLLTLESVGTTMDNLNTEILGDLAIPVPPLSEQRFVVAHIATETAKLDALRSATERTIVLLKERRAALIAAAVTGKIDVSVVSELDTRLPSCL